MEKQAVFGFVTDVTANSDFYRKLFSEVLDRIELGPDLDQMDQTLDRPAFPHLDQAILLFYMGKRPDFVPWRGTRSQQFGPDGPDLDRTQEAVWSTLSPCFIKGNSLILGFGPDGPGSFDFIYTE